MRIRAEDQQRYRENAYRVILTRARQGMVIYVPEGDGEDPTRMPAFYDGTYEYLGSVGIPRAASFRRVRGGPAGPPRLRARPPRRRRPFRTATRGSPAAPRHPPAVHRRGPARAGSGMRCIRASPRATPFCARWIPRGAGAGVGGGGRREGWGRERPLMRGAGIDTVNMNGGAYAAMQPYTMTISRNTIDKLGVKLYDKAADVLAEIVSNSYDADAERVTVRIPAGTPLATRKGDGTVADRGLSIAVEDDGHGMTPCEANDFYLKVGSDRRADTRRGSSAPCRANTAGRSWEERG